MVLQSGFYTCPFVYALVLSMLVHVYKVCVCTQADVFEEMKVLVDANTDLREKMNAMEYVDLALQIWMGVKI